MSMKDREELYGWIFTYNPNTGNYRACERSEYLRFFNEPEENFIRSKSIDTLEELIIKREKIFAGEIKT